MLSVSSHARATQMPKSTKVRRHEIPTYETIADAYVATIQSVIEYGHETAAGQSQSVGTNRSTLELSNYQFRVSNAAARLTAAIGAFALPFAAARFFWLISLGNRVEDMALYHPNVRNFSDDGILVPGSNFGYRLFAPRPGMHPVSAVVAMLRDDPNTRRATIPIYFSEDVGRNSRDVPCALALHFTNIDGALDLTVMMRSNNAVQLLGYNLNEFAWFQELVARELNLSVGGMTYYALSMHIYSDQLEQARAISEAGTGRRQARPTAMPAGTSPMAQVKTLCSIEAAFRQSFIDKSGRATNKVMERARRELVPYWRSISMGLMWTALSQNGGDHGLAEQIGAELRSMDVLPLSRLAEHQGAGKK
jgi:thymidylate synthase